MRFIRLTRRWFALGLLAAAAISLGGCANARVKDSDRVLVVLKEWAISGESGNALASMKAGTVYFLARNDGTQAHEVVFLRTDMPADKLPVKGDRVDEKAAGDTLGAIHTNNPGETKKASFQLRKGSYALICNIAGHYQSGMFAAVTVR